VSKGAVEEVEEEEGEDFLFLDLVWEGMLGVEGRDATALSFRLWFRVLSQRAASLPPHPLPFPPSSDGFVLFFIIFPSGNLHFPGIQASSSPPADDLSFDLLLLLPSIVRFHRRLGHSVLG